MKKLIGVSVIFAIAWSLSVGYLFRNVINNVDNEAEKYKEKVGKELVIGKDTAKIVDYSVVSQTFTLSDGKTISSYLVFNEEGLIIH